MQTLSAGTFPGASELRFYQVWPAGGGLPPSQVSCLVY